MTNLHWPITFIYTYIQPYSARNKNVKQTVDIEQPGVCNSEQFCTDQKVHNAVGSWQIILPMPNLGRPY